MITQYVDAAMRRAHYEMIEDDGTFFGKVEGLQGVWANHRTLEGCREELREVLEDWLLIRFRQNLPIPVIEDIDLNGSASEESAA